jgi:hypothetical protein
MSGALNLNAGGEMMYWKNLTLLFVGLSIILLAGGVVQAAFDFDIPEAYGLNGILGGGDDTLPGAEHFQWINGINSGNGFNYFTGTAQETNIKALFLAPDNWDAGSGDPYEGQTVSTHSDLSSLGLSGSVFDDVYSYFYKVEQVGNGSGGDSLGNVEIFYNAEPGIIDSSGESDEAGFVDVDLAEFTNRLLVSSNKDGIGNPLDDGDVSEWFYMTSENWWGWQPLRRDSDYATGSTFLYPGHSSPSGMIPAPNPEASVVVLYVVGLIGMAGYMQIRKRNIEIT